MRILSVAAALALAACGPKEEARDPGPASASMQAPHNNCPATAAATWTADGGVAFTIEASAVGATCADASATITFKNDAHDTAFTETYPASQVMTLAGAESAEDMQRRLGEWIMPGGAAADSTGDLPQWAAGAQSPSDGEFPFYPDEGMDRSAYEALRARDIAMFCYVQGMESQACFAMQGGALRKIGVQTFPG